jgi:predicted nucleic acid-binding Zn ribbon protein
MPTYVYETIPAEGETPTRFEVKQSMLEPALIRHPETGEPVRRVVSGGYGYVKGPATADTRSAGGGDCCPGC